MSDNIEIETTKNPINWIEEAITKDYFKYYEYKNFSNFKEIGSGAFGTVYRAKWKNSNQYLALKCFFKLGDAALEEIIREVIFYEL